MSDAGPFSFEFPSALAGLPGGAHHDLLQPTSTSAPAAAVVHYTAGQGQGQLDPRMLTTFSDDDEFANSGLPFGDDAGGGCYYSISHSPPTNNMYPDEDGDVRGSRAGGGAKHEYAMNDDSQHLGF